MSPRRARLYKPRSNGKAMQRAREEKGLDEEIALLRVMLGDFVSQKNPDDGLILSAVNTLGRALLAQARIGGVDPEATRIRVATAIRQLGLILEEDHQNHQVEAESNDADDR